LFVTEHIIANSEEKKKLNSKFGHLEFCRICVTCTNTSLLLYCKVEAQDLELFLNYTGVNIQKRNYTITKIIILQTFEFSRKFLFTYTIVLPIKI
jgi:hypothetical protein